MAVLNASGQQTRGGRGKTLCRLWLVVSALLLVSAVPLSAQSKEYQIKAAFLYNFSQFIEWPPTAFGGAQEPIVLGIIGEDPFGAYLDELVRGEKVNNHPLVVQRYASVDEIKNCHVLFISRSKSLPPGPLLESLKGRSTLTVGDSDEAARAGVMIRFFTDQNKIRLRINVEAAKAVNLTISSKLLKAAEIVSPGKD